MLRKIAKDPMSVLGSVQEILPLVQSQLHDYPGIKAMPGTAGAAIAQAIATKEPQVQKLQISPEQYQPELAQLEAAEVKRLAQQQDAITLNTHLESFLEIWQLGGKVTEISSEILAEVAGYLETSEDKGYLGAVTDSWQDEHRFCLWLFGEEMKQPVAVDPNRSLMVVFEQWSKGLKASVSEREFVAHYIQLAARKRTLNALVEDKNEQQCFLNWLSQPELVVV